MKFNLWNCEGKRFPPSVFLIVWVGFTKLETPRDVPDSVFGLYLRLYSNFLKSETWTYIHILYIYISHHVYFPAQLVGGFTLSDPMEKPWSQVSSLPPLGTCLHF